MAADKEIMKALETLRLDRPGRLYNAGCAILPDERDVGPIIIASLRELAATFREEAGLWAKSGARGWKSSETEAFLIAQAVDEVAAQLDNAGGGAALSVSTQYPDNGCTHGADCNIHPEANGIHNFDEAGDADLEAELRESAKRVDALPGTGASGLDALIADSVAQRKGMVRDELLPDGHPARSDAPVSYGVPAPADPAIDAGTMALATRVFQTPEVTFPGQASADDVTAYLRGETNDISGSPPLTPNSIISAPEADNPFEPVRRPFYCLQCETDEHRCHGCGEPVEHGKYACAQCELIHADGAAPECCQHMLAPDEDPAPWCDCNANDSRADDAHPGPCKKYAHLRADHLKPLPKTWESETMTADGHLLPGVAKTTAPPLGQPGDMGTGYSHDYVPPGGRRLTYAELLTPVPAASLPPHLSHSQGNTISDCATKYRLQRVEQLPQVPQWANVGGSAFHAFAEEWERAAVGVSPDGVTKAAADVDVAARWRYHFEGQINAVAATTPVPISMWRAARKGAEGRQWWEVNGPLMLRRYLDARPAEPTSNLPAQPHVYGATGDPFQLAIELELTVDVPTPYGPIPFKAQIDRVTNAPQPGPGSPESNWITLVIRDYKTGYERPTDTTQLGEYAHALRLWGVPESVKILGTYFDARRGEWTTPVDLLQAHPFEAFQYRVTTAYAQRRALTTGPTPARPSSYCGGCSVRYACPIMATKS